MRSKRLIATSLMTIMLSTGGAFAQSSSVADGVQAGVEIIVMAPSTAKRQAVKDLVAELKVAGFIYIEIHRTFLGRARVLAISATEMREIILNPTTGEVLRDLVQENRGDAQGKANSHAADGRENGNKGGNGNNANGNNVNGNNDNSSGGNGN